LEGAETAPRQTSEVFNEMEIVYITMQNHRESDTHRAADRLPKSLSTPSPEQPHLPHSLGMDCQIQA